METDQANLTAFIQKTFGRTPDILECLANLSSDEVFTHPKLANDMLDLLPAHVWADPNLKWLDPGAKSGVFLREIAKRLLISLTDAIPDEQKRREHIFKNMLYGIAITNITALVTRRTVYCAADASCEYSAIKFDDPNGNIFFENLPHTFKSGKCIHCGIPEQESTDIEQHAYNFIHPNHLKQFNNMKFDVIVGNPPYQMEDGGNGASAKPLYHLFIERAKALLPQYVLMITPSRWFAGGKGLDEFRDRMLNDNRISHIVDFPNANECFPDVKIEGGVNYFLWDKDHKGDCQVTTHFSGESDIATRPLNAFSTFIRFNKAIAILNKIAAHKEPTMEDWVMSRKPFGLPTNIQPNKTGDITLFARGSVGKFTRAELTHGVEIVDKWKVLISRAYGLGDSHPQQMIGKPIIAPPKSACTETYLVVHAVNTEEEATNLSSYLKTRFVRFLVSLKKSTQDTSKDRFSFVPQPDLTQFWDDEKLYSKYNITPAERSFIESIVKEME